MVDLPILHYGMEAILEKRILRTIMWCDEVYYGGRIRMRRRKRVTILHVLLLLPEYISIEGGRVGGMSYLFSYTFYS
jgi:hypothetical protein